MKTRPSLLLPLQRLAALAASLVLTAAASAQSSSVVVHLEGEKFGNDLEVHANSGAGRLAPARTYFYNVTGKLHGEGNFAFVNSQTIADFLESLEDGASDSLHGEYSNPEGTEPFTFLDRTYTGDRSSQIGTLHFSLHVVGQVASSGKVLLDVTDVQVTFNGNDVSGDIVFESSAKARIGVARVVQFKTSAVTVREDAGRVTLVVKRSGNTTGVASVQYNTDADNDDFVAKTGTLTFASGEVKKLITIRITDNSTTDPGDRTFGVFIHDPTQGTVIGDRASVTVTILDDEAAGSGQ